MKRIPFLLILPLIMAACTVEHPHADFSVSYNTVETDEIIDFYNHSWNADFFEWDFGDGDFSNSFAPSHVYRQPGTYEVTLTAYSHDDLIDRVSTWITVLYPTTLEITVKEYYNGYRVSNASVIIYPTLRDWENQTNAVADGYTDSRGVVVFNHLLPKEYFIDVWEEHHDNYLLAEDDVDFIRTLPLISNELNSFTAWVDYYSDNKKSGKIRSVGINSEKGRKFSEKAKVE